MKKRIILVLIFTLLLCACSAKETPAPAPAEPTAAPAEPTAEPAAEQTQEEAMYNSFIIASLDTEGKRVWSGAEAGIKEFRVPEAWTGAKGGIRAWYGFETNPGTGLARTDIVYIPSTEEAYDALIDELGALKASTEASEESFKKLDDAYINFQNGIAVLFSVIAVPNNGEPEKARELMLPGLMNSWLLGEEEAKARLATYTFIPAGTAEDYSFYLITSPLDVRNAFDGEKASWKEEYDALHKDIAAYAENFTFARPVGMADLTNAGTAVRFETTDLEGNPVSSSGLLSGHKATMINIWATTCVGCISEMPQLNRMAKEFADAGGQIIGIVYDATEPDLIEEAKEIVSELNVEFTNLLPNDEIKQLLAVQSYPTTYFVNDRGELAGDPVVGSMVQAYRSRMAELLGN